MSVNLKEQKKVALVVFFSLGFFIYGVSGENNLNDSTLLAQQNIEAPARGIASVPD